MKTPQEAAREYVIRTLCSGCYAKNKNDKGSCCAGFTINEDTYLAGDAFGYRRGQEKAYRWICVEDELPEVGKNGISATVLVRAGNYHCASYCKNKHYPQGAWFDPAMDLSIDVTHWRPIEPVNK